MWYRRRTAEQGVERHMAKWIAAETARYRCLYFKRGRGAAAVERYPHHGTPLKKGSDRVRQLHGHLTGSARRPDTAQDHRLPPQRVLRAREDPAGGTEWFPIEPFYHQYDVVCDSSATEVGAEVQIWLYVCFIDLYQSVRLR